jgi:hypothetical protein
MDMFVPVESSNIDAIAFFGNDALVVRFHNQDMYLYSAPVGVYEDMLAAPSKGRFLNSQVKPHYPARKIESSELDLLGRPYHRQQHMGRAPRNRSFELSDPAYSIIF